MGKNEIVGIFYSVMQCNLISLYATSAFMKCKISEISLCVQRLVADGIRCHGAKMEIVDKGNGIECCYIDSLFLT